MTTAIDNIIKCQIEFLSIRLHEANLTSLEALAAIRSGKRNQAVGTLMSLEHELKLALPIYHVIIAAHQTPETLPGEGGASCR